MKWYLHKHHKQHLEDLKVKRQDPLETYYPWVSQIANQFPKDEVAIGSLNLQDLTQAGYLGLIDAYDKLDHTRGQAEKWTYIKKRIKWAIRREIDKYGSTIATPINKLEERRNALTTSDKILVDVFPKFFKELEPGEWDSNNWENEQLGLLLDDFLYSNFKNTDHVEMLRAFYGIDREKSISFKELSIKYRKPVGALRKIKQRMVDTLKQNTEFKLIINNFYSK